ncbi:MAG TPA: DUF502 domain-containing protein [Thermoanaerobaculia bacterium]|nr:DUF502 domain-containing protein [Thermoanaerobaculia bacterium]
MNFLVKNFLRGLAIVVPISATVWLIWATVVTIDRWLGIPWPGAGIAVTLALILLVGVLAGNVIGRTFFQWTELIFVRAPLVKIIYMAIKDLVEAFVGDRRKFNRPVVVDLTELGQVKALGFITRDSLEFLPDSDLVAVYFPQSYNIAGNLLLVPRSRVHASDADSAQVMAVIVSGGISGKSAT